ncbi:MAG: hypothetical protein LLF99_09385 [Desulfobacteraceae bacterium]|nr:hypothetical protein [Desulfobacteraceae bacterium]
MTNAKQGRGTKWSGSTADPEQPATGLAEALRAGGTALDRFNRQFLAGVAKASETLSGQMSRSAAGIGFLQKSPGKGGIGKEFDGAAGRFAETAREMNDTGKVLASGLRKTFHGFLDTGFKSELRNAESSWKGFCNSMEKVFLKTVSRLAGNLMQQAVQGLFDWISGSFGFSSGFGSGKAQQGMPGVPLPGLESLSRSLTVRPVVEGLTDRAGEIFFTRGSGERVLNRRETAAYGKPAAPVQVQVQVINQTGTPVKAEQGPVTADLEKAVVGVVLKSYNEGGSIWQMIRGEKGK